MSSYMEMSEDVLASGINITPAPATDVLIHDEHVKDLNSSSPASMSTPVSEPEPDSASDIQSLPSVQSEHLISDVSQGSNQGPDSINHKESKEWKHKKQLEVQQHLTAGTKKVPNNMSHLGKNTQRVTLFVKNLDYSVDDQSLYQEFSQFGTIISAKVVMKDDHSRGFGFVCFSSPEEGMKAIMEMNGRMVGRKQLHVAIAHSREERKAYPRNQHEQRTKSRQPTKPWSSPHKTTQSVELQISGSATDEVPVLTKEEQQNKGRSVVQKTHKPRDAQRVTIFVKNLDYSVDDQSLREEFLQFGTVMSAKVVMKDDRSRGFGFVSFSSPQEAMKAIMEMNGRMVGRKQLHVAMAQSREERKAYPKNQQEQRMENRQPTKPCSSPHKTIQSFQLQYIQNRTAELFNDPKPPTISEKAKLIVKNLDYTVDDNQLCKEFMQFGTVMSAKVVMKNGCSQGFGFVCFSRPDEAAKAITEMNGKMLSMKPLHVALHTSAEPEIEKLQDKDPSGEQISQQSLLYETAFLSQMPTMKSNKKNKKK